MTLTPAQIATSNFNADFTQLNAMAARIKTRLANGQPTVAGNSNVQSYTGTDYTGAADSAQAAALTAVIAALGV